MPFVTIERNGERRVIFIDGNRGAGGGGGAAGGGSGSIRAGRAVVSRSSSRAKAKADLAKAETEKGIAAGHATVVKSGSKAGGGGGGSSGSGIKAGNASVVASGLKTPVNETRISQTQPVQTQAAAPTAKSYQGKIVVKSGSSEQKILAMAKAQGLKINSLHDLVSAAVPNHQLFPNVEVHHEGGKIMVNASTKGGLNHANRVFENGNLKNESFQLVKELQGKGAGSDFFHQQVLNSEKIGVKEIHTVAERYDNPANPTNGYYTWARLGYNGNIPDPVYAKMGYDQRDALPNKKVSDLMATEAGRQFWKEYGVTTKMSFDPKAGSTNRMILDKYMQERAKKNAG